MKLYLLRHAQSAANADGIISCKLPGADLSDTGREQAREVARKITELTDIKKIYCSPFRRTIETIRYVNLPSRLILDDRLKELDYGNFDGKLQSEVENEIIQTMERIRQGDNKIRFGVSGESQQELISRIYNFLIETIEGGETVLAVTHECVISIIGRLHRKLRKYDKKIKAENGLIIDFLFKLGDAELIRKELLYYN